MASKDHGKTDGILYAINKTAGKAFRKAPDADKWESVDPKSVPDARERAGHQKIGDNWFSVFKTGEGEK
ncbi:MAG TPA: hypothetical protein VHB98_21380 [Chloroflexota bacterium]|jgi:hypothetical protein|nr:hypothetical protein [Chloroflexota bacterium]